MEVINNIMKQQFELEVGGEKAIILYKMKGNKIILKDTQVPASMKGQGIGSKLASQTFDLIEKMGLKIIPTCEFIQAWLKRHPERQSMVILNGLD